MPVDEPTEGGFQSPSGPPSDESGDQELADIEAAREALGGLWAIGDEDQTEFRPLGVPGRYEVDPEKIRAGGMGFVCEALDVELGRVVAYKVMKPLDRDDPLALDRFLREATLTADLRHPGIVPILGMVTDDSGQPAYAMELVQGPTLAEAIHRLRAKNRLEIQARRDAREKLLRDFTSACRIAAYAHSRGVIHGDIKPLNILIDEEFDATWLIDWGLATEVTTTGLAPGVNDPSLSPPPGTRSYQSPSVLAGTPATVSSDIYALGVTLALILAESVNKADSDELCPAYDTPAAFWAIAQTAMHPERSGRYESANDLAKAVEDALADKPVKAYRDPWTTRSRRWVGRHRVGMVVSVSSVLMIAIVMTAAALGRSRIDRERVRYGQLLLEGSLKEVAVHFGRIDIPKTQEIGHDREVVRLFLTKLESGKEDPNTLKALARTVMDTMNSQRESSELNEKIGRELAYKRLVRDLPFVEQLHRERPQDSFVRGFLGGYYVLIGSAASSTRIDLSSIEDQLKGFERLDPVRRSEVESVLAWFDKAIAVLPSDRDVTLGMRKEALFGRSYTLAQLGRFTDAVIAIDQSYALSDGADKQLLRPTRSAFFKAATIEQGRMPWSKPPHVDHEKAIRLADVIAEHEEVNEPAIYNVACAYSLASRDEKANATECRRRADRAMMYLKGIASKDYFQTKASGFVGIINPRDTLNELRIDPDLDPLRDRADFREMVKDVTEKAGQKR